VRFSLRKKRAGDPGEHPTSRLVERILRKALEARASDVHLEPSPSGGGRVRLRVDGFFRVGEALDADLFPRVVARLKVLAGLAVFKTEEPQEGRIRFETPGGSADLRLSTLPVLGGEKAVVRLFDLAHAPRRLAGLGLSPGVEAAACRLLDLPSGVVYVIGPSSCGKTTTLYALARELLAVRGDWTGVVSVEDPVEQQVEGMSQTEVNPHRGLTFSTALASLLRQDPEVLFVGETRDPETARMAVEAGFTGHRVFTSMHVGEPAEVPRRLALMGVPEYLIGEALRGVVNQRLLRRLCPGCRGQGCEGCGGSGYRGRFAVAEVARYLDGAADLVTPSLEEEAAARREGGETGEAEIARVLGVPA